MSAMVDIQLNVQVDIFTPGSAAEVVNAILESLLYQRNQIPFAYKTYRYYVNKWLEEENKLECISEEMHTFRIQRQRDQAKKTKNAIGATRQVINDAFRKKSVRCLRFLFGATAFTPKEAYTIHIPPNVLSTNHCHEQHMISSAQLNQTLISLLTSEKLYTIFSNNLHPTNMFMELETFDMPTSLPTISVQPLLIFPKDFAPLPSSCKNIQIYLLPKCNEKFDDKQLKCCRELKVFEDASNGNNKITDSHEKEKREKEKQSTWWESEIVVRGFKDQSIKGKSLWT